jgi:hypothetical protein
MSYVARHYRGRLQAVERRDAAVSQDTKGSKIRALLDFLGIGRDRKAEHPVENGLDEEEQLGDIRDRGAA